MTSVTPKFSIITVCLNAEATIGRALQSVRQQSCRDFECVIIDGVSTDGTLDVVRSFSDLPVALWSEPDGGIYEAMNRGVAKAKGEIVFFLNADDALHDARVLERVAEAFAKGNDVDVVWGDVASVHEGGEITHKSNRRINAENLVYRNLCHQTVFAKRTLFAEYGGFDTRFTLCADFDWLLRTLRGGASYRYLPVPVAYYFVGGASYVDPARVHRERTEIQKNYLGESSLFWMSAGERFKKMRRYPVDRLILVAGQLFPALKRGKRYKKMLRRLEQSKATHAG